MKPYYIAAYDTEMHDTRRFGPGVPTCLEACRRIVAVHRPYSIPATFFLVGRTLDANPDDFRELLDHPLPEVGSHPYSHRMFRNHPLCRTAATPGAFA